MISMPRGGAREGAGRKKGDKYLVRFWVTADEEIALKGYLARMRAAHRSEADILADLEKTGQGKLFDSTATKTKKKAVVLQENNETISFNEWSMQLKKDINNALKVSKKAATAILAQKVCNTLNDSNKNVYGQDLKALAAFMDLLRDRRKRTEMFVDDTEKAEVFLLRNGYVKHFDENTMRSIWKKSLLHIE
uniref:Uncharacterized protein n=1 Tax=uncultured prokaryote TaxID=198431 RepID=A0A0H5PXE0_9ZZZZ|nr:hypothetical protein [uncultured prokaryote]